eukprot:11329419-Prorocentrum_lima.AAC.1
MSADAPSFLPKVLTGKVRECFVAQVKEEKHASEPRTTENSDERANPVIVAARKLAWRRGKQAQDKHRK